MNNDWIMCGAELTIEGPKYPPFLSLPSGSTPYQAVGGAVNQKQQGTEGAAITNRTPREDDSHQNPNIQVIVSPPLDGTGVSDQSTDTTYIKVVKQDTVHNPVKITALYQGDLPYHVVLTTYVPYLKIYRHLLYNSCILIMMSSVHIIKFLIFYQDRTSADKKQHKDNIRM